VAVFHLTQGFALLGVGCTAASPVRREVLFKAASPLGEEGFRFIEGLKNCGASLQVNGF